MLNLITERDMDNSNIISLLEKSKYLENRTYQPSQTAMTTSSSITSGAAYQLTVHGFQFILMNQAQQAQSLILNYIQTSESLGVNPVQLLQFIFTLSLTEPR